MELNPVLQMTKPEAIQLSNVLNQAVFYDERKNSGEAKLSDSQKMLAALAIAQLRDSDSSIVSLEFESRDELNAVVGVARVALEDPRGIMFGLITDLDDDPPTNWDQRGDALRSLAVAADFVKMVQP